MADENKDNQLEDDGSQKKKSRFSIRAYSRVLREILNYLIMAIISAGMSYFVATSVKGTKYSTEELVSYETRLNDTFERIPVGSDWTMDEMLVNTADEVDPKIVKATIVVSYSDKDPKVLEQLSLRRTEIHSAVRNIIGSKKSMEINTTEKQQILAKEMKTSIQRIIGLPGIIEVFIKDFMVH